MKILYGICGIGRGHTMRQLPVIEALLAKGHQVAVFAYGESLAFFNAWGAPHGLSVSEVAVPFVVGNAQGLDMEATRSHPANQRDFEAINATAHEMLGQYFDKPDIVVTDYEPTAAQVAYDFSLPLITLDQQSKFLLRGSGLPPAMDGLTPADEIARLRYFFPQATKHLACSFFRVEGQGDVQVIPPTLRPAIRDLKQTPTTPPSVTVYATTANGGLPVTQVVEVLKHFPQVHFHLFGPVTGVRAPAHVTLYHPSEETFLNALSQSSGIITSAGHSLLSEAMYLGLPVLAVPMPIYEQRVHAHVIAEAGFGLSTPQLTRRDVDSFLQNLSTFRQNIENDETTLLRGDGTEAALEIIEALK